MSTGWDSGSNTGVLDTSVAEGAREKYTEILGGGRDEMTILVYLCGTDLESRSKMATADLQEMLNADLSDAVNLIVYTGGCSNWQNNVISSRTNQIWQITDEGLLCLDKNVGSKSMTDPDTLSSFIRWGEKNYPANRMALIFWDHGGGSVSGFGYDEKFASSGSMDLAEIDRALTDGGVKFDFVGFDACLMATTETALMLSGHADYLIASEETEPGIGWYYTDWLTALSDNPSMPTLEIGKAIIDDFVDTCARKCAGQSTTLSIIDLAEAELTIPTALAEFFGNTCDLIRSEDYAQVSNARSDSREFGSSSRIDQVDLVHLAKNMGTDEGNALAEVLLNLAEAEHELSHDDVAMAYIAQVRERVGLPTDKSLTGEAVKEALIHERKIELAYEGHLWWDMRRWRLSEEAYTGYRVHGLKITKEGSGYRYQYVDADGQDRKFLNRMYRLPIPDAELQNNNSIDQFPEWNF